MERPSRRQCLRGSLAVAGVGLLSGCGPLPFQAQPAKVPRIGSIWAGTADSPLIEAFRQGLQELGYAEGRNISVEWRFAEGQADRFVPLAAELAGLPLDVIVTQGAILPAVQQATTTIPIVFVTGGDPVSVGSVKSIAHPGGNATGLSGIAPQLSGKRLELLKEAFPRLTNVAILWNPQDQGMALEMGETRVAADRLGVRFQSVEARDEGEIPGAFGTATEARADALVVVFSALISAARQKIVELAATSRLPAISGDRDFAAAGGLMAYGPSLPGMWRRAATYVDKILKGANPADLPVEQPTRFDFVVNLKTARALGLTIPQEVLMQATEVIQ
jgi:putative ABC transport system substrate-binding protein